VRDRLRRWLRGAEPTPAAPEPEEHLTAALDERDRLLEKKERVLRAFRNASKALERRGPSPAQDHTPERRGI
jgi:hypothetical protein